MGNISWKKVSKEMVDKFDVLLISKSDLNNDIDSNQSSHYRYHKALKEQLIKLGFRIRTTHSLGSVQNEVTPNTFVYGIHSHSWFNGKELFTSAISEFLGVPYLGPRPTVRALTEDKKLSKLLAVSLGIRVPNYAEIKQGVIPDDLNVDPPWILKPRNGIASQFIFYCADSEQLVSSLSSIPDEILASTDFLIEQFVPGINLTVPIIDGVSDCQLDLIVFQESDSNPYNILTHQGKRGITEGYSFSRYDDFFLDKVIQYTNAIRENLGEIDYGRIDFRCDPNKGEIYFLEINLICNMSQGTAIERLANEYGANYDTLVEHVVSHSLNRQMR
jgi:D-alanine-D-alanine ligase